MTLNVDFNGIKTVLASAYQASATQANKWIGYSVAIIKSGIETALPYLQDKRIAAVSLIAVNFFLCECANISHYFLHKYFPNDTSLKRSIRDGFDVVGGIAIVAVGVTAFARYTKIPFSPLAILGISLGTIAIRSNLGKNSN